MEPDKREYYQGFWRTVQERALFNNFFFLDNYLPLVPTIYAVVSRTSDNFNLYVSALTIIWLMFLCFGCPHYNKSPPVLLICSTGKKNSHLILAIFFTLLAFTEYLVEYFHSIICYQTSPHSTPDEITRACRSIFALKHWQENYRLTMYLSYKESMHFIYHCRKTESYYLIKR